MLVHVKPMDTHWNAIKIILKYLAGAIDFGVHFKPSTILAINGFYTTNW